MFAQSLQLKFILVLLNVLLLLSVSEVVVELLFVFLICVLFVCFLLPVNTFVLKVKVL